MTKFTVGEKRTATVKFLDKNGRPATVDGIPEWGSSNPGAFAVTPAANGLSAEVVCTAIGPAQITCIADADLDAGERRELTIMGEVEGVPEEAISGTMEFSAPL